MIDTIWYDDMIYECSMPASSNWKHIRGSLKTCTISKTTEREKQSHGCALPSAGCPGLWTSLQLHTEHPLLLPLTHTSALCCKKRDSWLSPPETDMQLEVITSVLLVQSVATGKPLSYSSPPCPPHVTAWLLINSNGVCEQGWWSDLDLSQADLPRLTTSRASVTKFR